MNQGLSY